MAKKTKADIERLISQTNAEISNLDQAIERLASTLAEIEEKISTACVRREELEKFSIHAPTWLSTGEISLEQFAENGQLIDAVTAEIDRFSDLHDATDELRISHEQKRGELQTKLHNQREMLMTVEAETLAEAIIKKADNELKQLLAILGRHGDQPSGTLAGSLIENTLYPGGQMPRNEKQTILNGVG